jgi:hypothetical protein
VPCPINQAPHKVSDYERECLDAKANGRARPYRNAMTREEEAVVAAIWHHLKPAKEWRQE